MRLSTATELFMSRPDTTVFDAIDTAKHVGFDCLDMSFFNHHKNGTGIATDDWRDWAHRIREHADRAGILFRQAHGMFVTGMQWDDPDYPERDGILALNTRCIEAAKILGVEWMVIHPLNLPHDPVYNRQKAKDANLTYLAPFIDKARAEGIGLAIENMVDFVRNRRRYCGGDPDELLDLVDTIHDPAVGICIDTGHSFLAGMDVASFIRLAGERVKALHINDNRQKGDEHLVPFDGLINWPSVLSALRDIGYDHDFAFELARHKMPEDVLDSWYRYVYTLGRSLIHLT